MEPVDRCKLVFVPEVLEKFSIWYKPMNSLLYWMNAPEWERPVVMHHQFRRKEHGYGVKRARDRIVLCRPLPKTYCTVPNYAEEDLGMMAFALSACDKTLPPDWNREEMTDYWVEKISRRRIRERLEKRIDLARRWVLEQPLEATAKEDMHLDNEQRKANKRSQSRFWRYIDNRQKCCREKRGHGTKKTPRDDTQASCSSQIRETTETPAATQPWDKYQSKSSDANIQCDDTQRGENKRRGRLLFKRFFRIKSRRQQSQSCNDHQTSSSNDVEQTAPHSLPLKNAPVNPTTHVQANQQKQNHGAHSHSIESGPCATKTSKKPKSTSPRAQRPLPPLPQKRPLPPLPPKIAIQRRCSVAPMSSSSSLYRPSYREYGCNSAMWRTTPCRASFFGASALPLPT